MLSAANRPFLLYRGRSRSLFGGTKRECGVGTVGSEIYHLITGCGYFWLAERPFLATRIPALRLDTGCRTLRERYFPAMESTQRYGRRGVSNPPSCTSPQRPLIRRGGWLLGAIRYAIRRGGPSGRNAGTHLLTVLFSRDTMAKDRFFYRLSRRILQRVFHIFHCFFHRIRGFSESNP